MKVNKYTSLICMWLVSFSSYSFFQSGNSIREGCINLKKIINGQNVYGGNRNFLAGYCKGYLDATIEQAINDIALKNKKFMDCYQNSSVLRGVNTMQFALTFTDYLESHSELANHSVEDIATTVLIRKYPPPIKCQKFLKNDK